MQGMRAFLHGRKSLPLRRLRKVLVTAPIAQEKNRIR